MKKLFLKKLFLTLLFLTASFQTKPYELTDQEKEKASETISKYLETEKNATDVLELFELAYKGVLVSEQDCFNFLNEYHIAEGCYYLEEFPDYSEEIINLKKRVKSLNDKLISQEECLKIKRELEEKKAEIRVKGDSFIYKNT